MTSRCNLDCIFCYNVWKTGDAGQPADLDTGEMIEVAAAVADAGPVSVSLTGGEPLLRGDLEEIARYLGSRGIMVGIATNGTLLYPDRIESLIDSGVRWFEVPVHATRPDIAGDLVGRDCLDEVKNAILEVRKAGARLTVSHLMTSMNYGETARAVRLAYALGAEAMALNRFVPTGAGAGRPDLLPLPSQLDAALAGASEISSMSPGIRVYTAIPVEDCLHPHVDFPGIEFGTCSCGVSKWAVSPRGDLRICEQSPVILGNLLESSFREMTCSGVVTEFRASSFHDECSECRSWNSCGGGCRYLREYL